MTTEVSSMPNSTATMYLRNMPSRLVREAKAAAAERGTTLTAIVKEALEGFLTSNKSARSLEASPIAKDLAWYEGNKPKLLRRYAGEYVAIINKRVVDHDKEFAPLAQRVFKRYGVRSIAMPRVVPGDEVVNIPSPRIVR
jgi:hypothetical protein